MLVGVVELGHELGQELVMVVYKNFRWQYARAFRGQQFMMSVGKRLTIPEVGETRLARVYSCNGDELLAH